MENNKTIDRREALRRTAWFVGGTISAPTLIGILNGCTPKETLSWTPTFFTPDQASLVNDIVVTIIPSGETPGAAEVGVPAFIDEMVGTIYSQKQQEQFINGMQEFMINCKEAMGSDFSKLEVAQKEEIIKAEHAKVKDIDEDKGEEEDEVYPDEKDIYFMSALREMTLVGYCISEIGMTQVLKYIKVPGEYKGCIPAEEVGGVWAIN